MRKSCNKSTHAKNLYAAINNVKITQRHSNTFRRLPLHGFTLIEVLVVIAIIALLSAIVMPALKKARQTAQGIVCLAHIRAYGSANLMYSVEEDGKAVWQPWLQTPAFLKILGLDDLQIEENMNSWGTAPFGKKYICPASEVARRGRVDLSDDVDLNTGMAATYGYNHSGQWWDPRPGYASGNIDEYCGFFKIHNIPSPSQKIMFLDSGDISVNSINGPYTTRLSCINAKLGWDQFGDIFMLSTAPPAMGVVSYRHGERANVVFYDGHAEKQGKEDLWHVGSDGDPDNGVMRSQWYLGRN